MISVKRILICGSMAILCSCSHPTTRLPDLAHRDLDAIRADQAAYARNIYQQQQARASNILYKLTVAAGPELCDRKLRADLGFNISFYVPYKKPLFWSNSILEKQDQDYKRKYGSLKSGAAFAGVVKKGSPAEKAGMKQGDRILSIYGRPVPSEPKEWQEYFEEIDKEAYIEGEKVFVEVERDNQTINLAFLPQLHCPYNVSVDRISPEVNAYADGEKIVISSAALNYFTDDNDIAGILAHELAHNAMGHINSQKTNRNIGIAIGFIGDFVAAAGGATPDTQAAETGARIGANAYTIEFEMEADYVSAYYMARAGYDYHKLKDMQKKLAAVNWGALYSEETTHPAPQRRYALIEETARQIDMKKEMHMELLPDFAEKNSYLEDKKD